MNFLMMLAVGFACCFSLVCLCFLVEQWRHLTPLARCGMFLLIFIPSLLTLLTN